MFSFLSSLFLSATLSFGSPVNYPITLAGNFGEPRPNHFHGGIDVRTEMVEGKPIFSVADGYVCRVTVGLNGFGNALYIRHPNGITTVYCHLKKFVPQIEDMVRKWQYENQNCFADVRLRPTDFPVSKGQFVAVSGNTGASSAPHLHLEFHETKTGNFIDPLDYLKDFVHDTTKPIAHSFMAYPVQGEGVFCGSSNKQSFGFTSTALSSVFSAWGKVGFGIWANDYMEGSYGILGVRKISLTIDGKIVFESDVDNIPTTCNRMVNSWGDYEHYCHNRVWYLKSFIDEGNTLPILKSYYGSGIFDFNEEREYHLVYTLTDVFGNSRDYTFTVKGRKQELPSKIVPSFMDMLYYNRLNNFQRPGLMLIVASGMLPYNLDIQPKVVVQPNKLSNEWSFYNKSFPLFGWNKISIKLNRPVKNPEKLYIVCHYGYDRYMGGTYEDGWVTGKINELGAKYEIAYDDEQPVLNAFNASAGKLRISAYDKKSGLSSVKGYVDGQFVLFEHQEKTSVYLCELKYSPIKKTGMTHNLKIVACDKRNNQKVLATQFKY